MKLANGHQNNSTKCRVYQAALKAWLVEGMSTLPRRHDAWYKACGLASLKYQRYRWRHQSAEAHNFRGDGALFFSLLRREGGRKGGGKERREEGEGEGSEIVKTFSSITRISIV